MNATNATLPALSSIVLTIGTRTSDLALWQTNYVMAQLEAAWPGLRCECVPYVTKGDKTQAQGKPLPAIGGKGLFTAELEESLRSGTIDLAVHSLKDLPVEDSPGLTLGAIANRADVRDALITRNGLMLETLPKGAIVGTSSTRRAAQLLAHRPDLTIRSIRGNVPTRIRKVINGDYDATLLALAGLERLGLTEEIAEVLPLEIMLPAPGQGALAIQCRVDDEQTLALLTVLDDASVRMAVTAERTFLHALGGGCSAPVATYATVDNKGEIELAALVGSTDGTKIIRVAKQSGDNTGSPEELGNVAATEALAQGADSLLTAARNDFPAAPTSLPLAGKRIVITRAEAQADQFANTLATLGAIPLSIPTIRIEPLRDLSPLHNALQRLAEYDWLIVTSVNSVGILADNLAKLEIPTVTIPKLKSAAVGSSTAEALRTHGIAPTFIPEEYVAEAIADGLGDVTDQRILLPQAQIARDTLAKMLTAKGATVDVIPIYQTVAVMPNGEVLAMLRDGIDLLTFTSGSTVRSFLEGMAAANGAYAMVTNATVACIGPVTAETARQCGLNVAIVAEEHTISGLINAIVDYYQQVK